MTSTDSIKALTRFHDVKGCDRIASLYIFSYNHITVVCPSSSKGEGVRSVSVF